MNAEQNLDTANKEIQHLAEIIAKLKMEGTVNVNQVQAPQAASSQQQENSGGLWKTKYLELDSQMKMQQLQIQQLTKKLDESQYRYKMLEDQTKQ